MKYTIVIRTLGTAGDKYQQELNSLMAQTMQPEEIIVYIAEGYPLPKETCGKERYVYVKKGMVAQRALQYDEVKTDWILFLDDDIYLPPNGVEQLFDAVEKYGADVISPNAFENHKLAGIVRVMNMILGKAMPFKSDTEAYRVIRSGGFGYNSNPTKDFYWSESNAGASFLCKKKTFVDIHFEDEIWLDESPYALPEDQVMFYKMHLAGYKVATLFNSGIVHLDAGTAVGVSSDRMGKMLYSEVKNQIIFWHRFIKPYNQGIKGVWARICLNHYTNMRRLLALKNVMRGDSSQWHIIVKAIKDAKAYINSRLL